MPELAGFYESRLPGIREGDDATPILNGAPAAPRGMFINGPWAEINPMWGYPGHGLVLANKFYYAAGGYTIGTGTPSIRVWDGTVDKELCKIPNNASNVICRGITFLERYYTYTGQGVSTVFTPHLLVGTWDAGTTSADVTGRVFQLSPNDGSLTVIGDSGGPLLGHVPYSCTIAGANIWLGTHRSTSAAAGAIFKTSTNNPSAWTLDLDLTASGQRAVVSIFAPNSGEVLYGTMAPSGTAAVIGSRSTLGVYSVSDTGTQTSDYNGYYAMTQLRLFVYAAYWDPTSATTLIRRRDVFGGPWSTVFTGAGSTQNHIVSLFTDGGNDNGTIYAIGARRVSGVYSGFVLFSRDGTTWTDVTAQLPLSGPGFAGTVLTSMAPTNAIGSISRSVSA